MFQHQMSVTFRLFVLLLPSRTQFDLTVCLVRRRRAGQGQGLVREEGQLCPRRFICSRGREYVVQSHTA